MMDEQWKNAGWRFVPPEGDEPGDLVPEKKTTGMEIIQAFGFVMGFAIGVFMAAIVLAALIYILVGLIDAIV